MGSTTSGSTLVASINRALLSCPRLLIPCISGIRKQWSAMHTCLMYLRARFKIHETILRVFVKADGSHVGGRCKSLLLHAS